MSNYNVNGSSSSTNLLLFNDLILKDDAETNKIIFESGVNTSELGTHTLTSDRILNFPDKNGTIAILSDIVPVVDNICFAYSLLYIPINSTSLKSLATYNYKGYTFYGGNISNVSIILKSATATTTNVTLQIQDITNAKTVATLSILAYSSVATYTTHNFTIIPANIPSAFSVFELQGQQSSVLGSRNIYIYGLSTQLK